MVQIKWTEKALEDLNQVYVFIAQDSKKFAALEIKKLLDASLKLNSFPRLGRKIKEVPGSDYRQLVIGTYRLIYKINDDSSFAYILALAHVRRKRKL